ncbi:MAG: hypothetical protein WCR19_01255, partial [Acholeplasmataceae bacterium]
KLPKELMPYIVGFLQTDNSIDQIEDFVKSDFNILDLDTYIEETSLSYGRYDEMAWIDFKTEQLPYVLDAHQHMRRNGIRMKHLIGGNVLRKKFIFQKLINSGFTHFIIPLSSIRLGEEIVSNHERTRGRFIGVSQKRRMEKASIKSLN